MSYNKSSMKVVIWSHFISPRLEYIAQWLENRWSIPVIINQEFPALYRYPQQVISYQG